MKLKESYVLVDLWGTLAYLSRGPDFGLRIARLLEISKQDYIQEVTREWFRRPMSAMQFAEYLVLKYHGTSDSVVQIAEWIESPLQRAHTYIDTLPALSAWRKMALVCIVSDTSTIGETVISQTGLDQVCDHCYLSHRLGLTKQEGLYKVVLDDLKINADKTLVVGNCIKNDYFIPKQHGCNVVLLDRRGKYPNIDERLSSLRALR